ncbi:O-antigen ligase family protein [Candidatus Peregrinibacteria bacterium]|nr:O-antigen ligase family protein [Candidatus Peregrinibacteria bacterium]
MAISFLGEVIRTKQTKKVLKNIRKHWILIAFSTLTLLSLILVPIFNFIDLARHLKFLFFGLIFAFVLVETLNKKNEQEKALKLAGYGAMAFGIFSVIFNLLGYNIAHDLRLLGPLDAAVYLGYYLAPFFIYFSIKSFGKPTRKHILPAVILGLLIIATKSMGALGGTFLVLLAYLLKNYSRKILKNSLIKVILTIFTISIIAAIISTKVMPTLNTEYSSLDERGEIWKVSTELLKEPKNLLLGLGFGQFEHHYIENADQVLGKTPLDYHVIQPHNIFLLFTFHYGILGLAIIIFLITKVLIRLIKKEDVKEFDQIILFTLLYFFIHGLIDTPFFKNDMMILLLTYLSLGFSRKATN